jgi:xylan 1,4-beta-xylosidase
MNILCNPLNIDYKFQHIKSGHAAFRECADPTAILFKGKYYIFPSMSAGFWYSDDLFNWNFHENRNLPICDYAPDVRQIGDYLYFCASRMHEPSTFYRTKDPFQEQYEVVSSPFPFWDPHMFQDDDGRVYFYWGCSNEEPYSWC